MAANESIKRKFKNSTCCPGFTSNMSENLKKASNDDKALYHKDLDRGDIFKVNELIAKFFPKNNLEQLDLKENQQEKCACTSSTRSTTEASTFRAKWPLARKRICIPYSASHRSAKRRIQARKLLNQLSRENDIMSEESQQNPNDSLVKEKSSLEELKMELEELRETENRRSNWLCPGIIVTVVSRRLGRKFLGKMADVLEVKQEYTALIRFHHDNSVLYADQNHLQTFISDDPLNHRVIIVNGAYRGCTGILQERSNNAKIIGDNATFRIKINKGVFNGRLLDLQANDVASVARETSALH
ncbi:DNA/RNA-binding protein kin17 [Plakobranchus ocellatus]|uniref:DNA/RNA-binding protein kin17 n=1 Tax=Plakobranchus ocellatus TaxID=259542 RepID=A0AAV3XRV0_9GAST|nr:DNA/RNA-binding protein kin17 [Plakobranchus ocellatus]